MIGIKVICYSVLSLFFYMIPGGAAAIIVLWGWFLYEVHCYNEARRKHAKYIEERRESNRKMGKVFLD